MKRDAATLLIALSFACGREAPPPPAPKSAAPPPTITFPTETPKPRGTYDAAIERFRTARGLTFDVKDSDVSATGTMTRPRPGQERVEIRTKKAGVWTAEAQAAGVVWMHDGKRQMNEPPWADRIWQRTTMFLDPQKKEGAARLAESDDTTNHYHFTDANSGAPYDVWVSKRDGSITKLKAGTFQMTVR